MPTRKDATQLLKRDHEEIKRLFGELSETQAQAVKSRQELLTRLETLIRAHTKVEEELVYEALHERAEGEADETIFHEALAEHHAADLVLADIKEADPGSAAFSAKVKVLREIVLQHVKEEEKKLLPRLKQLMPRAELILLGQRLEARKNELMNGASNVELPAAPIAEAVH